jgi:GH18 family chitinase
MAVQPAPVVIYKAPANFRVVGYLLSGQIANGHASSFDVSRVNYLNVFFNSPQYNGKFKDIPHLDSIVTAAHSHHVKVLATIGNAIDMDMITDSCRAGWIDSLVSSVIALHLDGVDVDLEGEGGHINQDYEGFVNALSVALKAKGLLLTAAIATWESKLLSDKALACFDFLNIMTYDATGPWNIKDRGPHSPYSMAVSDFDFWTNKRHIPKEKLDLGLPFYGYGFEPKTVREFNYRTLIKRYPGAEQADSLVLKPDTVLYYNGIATIKRKTQYAMQNAGGVMIWELLGDADAEKSLLNAVDETANPGNN